MAKDMNCTVPELPSDLGIRFRITAETKKLGDNVIEVGSSYFYQFDEDVQKVADDFVFYAQHLGINVTLNPLHDNIRFNDAPWPKTSWATLPYEMTLHFVDQQCA